MADEFHDRGHEAIALEVCEGDFGELREAVVVEDAGDGFAHFHHDEAEAAVFLVWAGAAFVGGDAGATDGGERAVDVAHEVADHDLGGGFGEGVAAVLAAGACEEAGLAEADEDLFEEGGGDVLGLCEGGEWDEWALEGMSHGEIEQGSECVLASS